MIFVDAHCHIHESDVFSDYEREAVYQRAIDANVTMICVSTSEQASRESLEFCKDHPRAFAVVGVHPHDVKNGWQAVAELIQQNREIIHGIGEIGLDYYYDNSPRDLQISALEQQLQWASDYNLPVSFHVRDAFDDFWPIYKNFSHVQGVLHSYTDSTATLEAALSLGLYIGVNGISTFAKDKQTMFDAIPLEKMILETDAPFLTPVPLRGKVNEPAFVRHVAEYHANRRKVELEHLARVTSANASTLFNL